MPWKASSVMEERLRFVARLLDGEAMTDVCREFGVSRKTGYKIFDRYKEHGLTALSDRSRRPVRYANQLPQQVESLIVRLKADKPHWGARKIRELLVRRLDGDIRVPAKSTIHAVLDRHGLVKRGGGPRHRARGTPLSVGHDSAHFAQSRDGRSRPNLGRPTDSIPGYPLSKPRLLAFLAAIRLRPCLHRRAVRPH
jgi:transposase